MKIFLKNFSILGILLLLAGCDNFVKKQIVSQKDQTAIEFSSGQSAPAQDFRPTMTTWMPEDGQTHEIGYLSNSADGKWIKTWTTSRNDGPGSMLKTSPTRLPLGEYTATFQVWHKQSAGKVLGELRAWSGDSLIASKPLISETFPDYNNGGYQRAQLEFTIPENSENIWLELYYANNHYIWTGAVSLTRTTTKRPFYNIAHRSNTISKVNEMVNLQANAIECDITPTLVDDKIEFYVYHAGDTSYTNYSDFDEFLTNLKSHLDSQSIALTMFDCKQKSSISPEAYATALAQRLIQVGFNPDHVVMSVPGNVAGIFSQTLKQPDQNGNVMFDCGIDSYLESYSGLSALQWIEQVELTGASFVGVGIDAAVIFSPMHVWMPWIQTMTNRRDQLGNYKKAYFWTLNSKASMRKCIDYNCDGIITNYPDRLNEVLNEANYQAIVRPATQQDNQFSVHGFE
ncbi:MAG: hypothetical protein JXR63_01590 [Spirochaetales bacterium]|nr:hypothetical protein [Spirochaetales bacterium]